MVKFVLILHFLLFYGHFLVAQENSDAFNDLLQKREAEARAKLQKEKELNKILYDNLRQGLLNDDPLIRLRSLQSIMEMQELPEKESLIKDYLDDRVPAIRLAILDYYQKKKRRSDIRTLLEVVEDENLDVRLKLIDVIMEYQRSGQPVYELIRIMLEDKQLVIRRKILDSIETLPPNTIDQKELFDSIKDMFYDGVLDLRIKTLEIIGGFDLNLIYDILEAALQDQQTVIRRLALNVAAQSTGEKSTKLIIDSLADTFIPIRQLAVSFLDKRIDEEVIRVLDNHLYNERNSRLRIQILRAIAKDRSPLAVGIIARYLDDPVIEVRRFATKLLQEMQKTINLDPYAR